MYGFLAASLMIVAINPRRQIPGLVSVMLFCMVYPGGNFLVGSIGRQGVVVMGPILLWLAYQCRLLIDAGVVVPSRLREKM